MLFDPTWVLEQVAGNELPQIAATSAERASPGVLLIPVAMVLNINPHPFLLPVLAFGPPSLFDAVPDGFCDDLIGDQWHAAELRYRLRRLVHAEFNLGGHAISCIPLRLTSDDCSVDLTVIQFQILSMLLRADGASVPREALSAAMIAVEDRRDGGRALDMHISRLRKKLQIVTSEWTHRPRISAHRGSGYSLSL